MKTAAIVALLVTGCSFVGVRGGPPVSEHGGCTGGYPLPVTDLVVTGLAAATATAIAIAGNACGAGRGPDAEFGGRCPSYDLSAAGTGIIALAWGVSALYGFTKVSSCSAAKQAERKREAARSDAWALTKTAAAAARVGDCNTVRKIDLDVSVLDSEFHATVFLADIGIKRCVGPAVTPSIDAAPPTRAPPPVAPVHP